MLISKINKCVTGIYKGDVEEKCFFFFSVYQFMEKMFTETNSSYVSANPNFQLNFCLCFGKYTLKGLQSCWHAVLVSCCYWFSAPFLLFFFLSNYVHDGDSYI